jgi:uncharacterized protein (TIGR02996 family)
VTGGRARDDDHVDMLVAELVDHPDDADRRGVLADALQTLGDPHGELIALQCLVAPAADVEARARELVDALAAEIAGDVPAAQFSLEWRGGFVDRFVVEAPLPGFAERWPELTAHRCMRLLRAVRLDWQHAPEAIGERAVRALIATPLPAVRELALGAPARLPAELLDELLAHLPRLTGLELFGAMPPRFDTLGELTKLALWPRTAADRSGLAQLWEAPLPRLRELVLGGWGTVAYASFAPLLDGHVHAGVEHLAVMADFADALARDLPAGPILPRLRSLGMVWNRLSDAGQRALEAARTALAHVALVWPKPLGQPLGGAEAYYLGRLLRMRLGRSSDALPLYEQACAKLPQVADHWWALGNALGDATRRDEQLDAYARAVDVNPRHAGALTSRGKALVALGRLDDALASCMRAVEADPNRAGSWNELGTLQRRLGALDDAIVAFERAVAIAPAHQAGRNLFDTLLEAGRLSDALAHIAALRARAPDDAQLARKQGRAHLALGDPATALVLADKPVCDASSYYTRYLRVAALRELGRDADAVAACAALADDTAWHARIARVQEAAITRRPEPVGPDAGGPLHDDDCISCGVLAIAAAAVVGDDALLATRRAALDQELARREPGYALGRDWTILDAIAVLGRVATPGRVAGVADSYARVTGRVPARG